MLFTFSLDDIVDLRLASHCVFDGQFRGVVVVLVNLRIVGRFPVDENAADDDVFIGLVFRDHAFGNAVNDCTSDCRLCRAEHLHGLLGAFDRHFRDHDRSRFANQVRRDDGEQARVAGTLCRECVGKSHAHWTVLIANEQIDVGDFIAVANEAFADKHGHVCLAWREGKYLLGMV